MTDALSGMEYPHWLMVAGAILVVLGLVGLAFHQRPAPLEPTDVSKRQSDFEAQITQANRKAKLAEQTKGRWADKAKPTPGEAAPSFRDAPAPVSPQCTQLNETAHRIAF